MNLFYIALAFFSRIPTPKNLEYSDEIQSRAFRFFPLVGIIVGLIGAGCFVLSSYLFGHIIAVVIAIAAMMCTTGCLHEDGVADFFDAFGGSHPKEKRLAIMKDSHIGTYGVIALVILVALKIALFNELTFTQLPIVIVASQAFARVVPIVLINTSQYVRVGQSKASFTRKRTSATTFLIALAIGLIPLVLFDWLFAATLVAATTVLFICFRAYIHRAIGGFTGDVLGAVEQFSELTFLLIFISYL